MAIAVNSPFGWMLGSSFGASLYARIDRHQAVRFNIASYKYGDGGGAVIAGLMGEEDEGSYDGRLLDLGASWMYFPRRTFDGALFEVGLLRRAGDTSVRDDFADDELVERNTQMFAGRAMVGWSWLVQDRAMISFAVGASRGYELGHETTTRMSGATPMTHDVGQWTTSPEGYIRVGFTFGK